MKVLVTGGAGFIGSHLVDALVLRGDEVVVADNLHRGSLDNIRAHLDRGAVRFESADIREPGLEALMQGVEVVFHLAAQPNVMGSLTDADYSFTTNVLGTFNVLKSAATAGVRRVVFASSREVYGEAQVLPVREDAPLLPKNPYGASKMAGEAYCRAWSSISALDCYILRFSNVYGPRDFGRVIPIWLDRVGNGKDIELFGGQQVIDFVWIDQAVAALLAASTAANDGSVNVANGVPVTLQELAERILTLTGREARLMVLPAREAEVTRFVGDGARMESVLHVSRLADPLSGLPSMIGSAR